MRPAPIRIEILVHLIHNLVAWICQRAHGRSVLARCPRPRACPVVAFDVDVLRCGAGGTDPVDAGLVERYDEGLVHVVDCVG